MSSKMEQKAQVALRKLVAMSGQTPSGTKEQASQALRQLFHTNGSKSGEELDKKLATLLERTGSRSSLDPEELAEQMGPEPYRKPLPELPKRRLVLPEEGGLSAPMKVRVKDARKALQKKDQTVTQLTARLKQCRKEVWHLQCEANAADLKVARMLEKRMGELPEELQEQLQRLKDKEDALADELSHSRANAQRWASVAKRQDAMLRQEHEEQRGDAHSILAKHPAGEVFWSLASESESEDEPRRPGATEITLGSSDEDSYRPPASKARARSFSSDSASSGDSLDLPGTGPSPAVAKAVPPLPEVSKTQRIDADEVYSEISEEIMESSRSV